MSRTNLTKLLEEVAISPNEEPMVSSAKLQPKGEVPKLDDVSPVSEPLYLRYLRKETRLREDQQNGLTLLARRLSRAKPVGGERITDNTLIRIAVDLLLVKSKELAGVNEIELRRSVGLQ